MLAWCLAAEFPVGGNGVWGRNLPGVGAECGGAAGGGVGRARLAARLVSIGVSRVVVSWAAVRVSSLYPAPASEIGSLR